MMEMIKNNYRIFKKTNNCSNKVYKIIKNKIYMKLKILML